MPNFQRNFNLLFNYDVNKKTEWFTEESWKLYNNCSPKKTKIVSYKIYSKPCITDDIKNIN